MSKDLLKPRHRGRVFVLSAPSGTGKTTLVRMLTQESPCIVESISATTRPPRSGEREGKDYFFLTDSAFDQKVREQAFLEHASLFGFRYGTLKEHVDAQIDQGHHLFFVIDTQGALNLRQQKFDATYIFLSPPSEEALALRLGARKTDTPEGIARRLQVAKEEMQRISHYDYHIVNDDLQSAYTILKSIVIAEEYKIHRGHP